MDKEKGDEKKVDFKKITALATTIAGVAFSEGGRKFLCGTYSDGTPRSLSDALSGEIYSPEERKKRLKKLEKNKKSKKKKKKKSSSIDVFNF